MHTVYVTHARLLAILDTDGDQWMHWSAEPADVALEVRALACRCTGSTPRPITAAIETHEIGLRIA